MPLSTSRTTSNVVVGICDVAGHGIASDAISRHLDDFREGVPASDDQLAISYLDRQARSPTSSDRRVNSADAV